MYIKLKHFKNIEYLNFIILAIFSFIFPIYISDTNQYNLLFATAEIPLLIFLGLNLLKRSKRRNKIFLFIILIYFTVFFYFNVVYLKCYWALLYKTASFIMLWYFDSQESTSDKYGGNLYRELTDTILCIFSFIVVLSLIANVIGVDAIYLNLNAFHIRSATSGIFFDERLTWVFLHKSTYGLLLVLALTLLMKRENFRYRKLWIGIYFLTALRIASMVSLVSMCGVLFAYFMETHSLNRKTVIKIFISLFIGMLLGVVIYYVVSLERDLSSLGDRAYIWSMFKESLLVYPHGMGNRFFTDTFWLVEGGRYINNFHNVLFNELIHYSIPVGILFVVLIIYQPIRFINSNPSKIKNVILFVSIILPMVFDQALNDLIFPMFLIMLKLCFSKVNENERKLHE